MLWRLLSRMNRDRYDPIVFALRSTTDQILELFDAIRVPYQLLGMTPDAKAVSGLFRLARKLNEAKPDVVQGWLYHGNVAATISTFISRRRVPVLWSIRGAPIPDEKRLSRAIVRLCSMFAFSAKKIIYNSSVSAAEHEQHLGYRSDRRLIIPNGFDTDLFVPSEPARAQMRQALALPADVVLVGLIARYHRVKDHDTFLGAAALVSADHPEARFVLIGENIDLANDELCGLIERHRMTHRVHLLGMRDDMPQVTAALDICVSASTVEGFPNVVGEAMSCGVPCVVTDVGESALLVGDTGKNVPARDARALADAIAGLVTTPRTERAALGQRARERIIRDFSLAHIVSQYENLYSEIHSDARAGKA